MDSSPQSKEWLRILGALQPVLSAVQLSGVWPPPGAIDQSAERIRTNLEGDLKILQSEAGFLFSPHADAESLSRHNTEMLRRWHSQGRAPSLAALSLYALENMGLKPDPVLSHALLAAAILGEIESPLAYHNNMHYRKVLLQMIRLIAAHNDIYKSTPQILTEEEIILLMIAACVHDIGHDGLGNTVKGVFTQGRLERQSCVLAEGYLRAAGCEDEKYLHNLRILVLCTDVTPLDDPTNPVNQMKAAYRFHFLGENKKFPVLNLDPDLMPLQKNPKLTLMALLLHEADIATSAGLDYELTKFETSIYRQELLAEEARPEHVVEFLNTVCQRRILSHAGQALYSANMARILALAEEGIRQGNQPFPAVEHADFLLAGGRQGDPGSKTVN